MPVYGDGIDVTVLLRVGQQLALYREYGEFMDSVRTRVDNTTMFW